MDRKWWTLGAVCVGIFMLLLDLTIVNVALPNIQHDFHASLSDLQWVIDAYALTLAALLLTSGLPRRLARQTIHVRDRHRRVHLRVAPVRCLDGPLFIILSRGFQGIGGAIMFATSLAM